MGNLFTRLFGGNDNHDRVGQEQPPAPKGPSRVNEQDRAVLQLKKQRDDLHKYQKRIGIQLEQEREVAKKLLNDGKKERAKLLLKKKRYLESLLDKTDNQLDNMQQMIENIEFAQIEIKVVEGLKQGNECLENIHKIMSLEDVEKIMADTADAIEYQNEIDELLGQRLTDEDEDAVAAELEAIIAAQLPAVTGGPLEETEVNLPEVPTHEPQARETEQPIKQKRVVELA